MRGFDLKQIENDFDGIALDRSLADDKTSVIRYDLNEPHPELCRPLLKTHASAGDSPVKNLKCRQMAPGILTQDRRGGDRSKDDH